MSGIIYPYAQKPFAGTPYDPNHEQVQGLVGWWLMDEGMGLNVRNLVDPTGDTDGVMTNMANPATPISGWNAGQFGSALAFNGTNARVVIPDSDELTFPNSITISCWFFALLDSRDSRLVSKRASTENTYNLGIFTSNVAYFQIDTGSQTIVVTNTIPSVGWHHFAGTWDGITMKTYLDGIFQNSDAKSGSMSNVSTALWIGARPNISSFFNSLIDDVRLYDYAVPQPLIERIFSDGYPQFKRRVIFDVGVAVGSPSPRAGLLGPLYGSLAGPVG